MKSWKQIRAIIELPEPVPGGTSQFVPPLEIKDGVLLIGFANDWSGRKWISPEQMDITRKAIADVAGVKFTVTLCRLKCETTTPGGCQSRWDGSRGPEKGRRDRGYPGVIMAKGFNRPAGGGGQSGMMQQLQRLQQQMAEAQEKLAQETVTATAGGGASKSP